MWTSTVWCSAGQWFSSRSASLVPVSIHVCLPSGWNKLGSGLYHCLCCGICCNGRVWFPHPSALNWPTVSTCYIVSCMCFAEYPRKCWQIFNWVGNILLKGFGGMLPQKNFTHVHSKLPLCNEQRRLPLPQPGYSRDAFVALMLVVIWKKWLGDASFISGQSLSWIVESSFVRVAWDWILRYVHNLSPQHHFKFYPSLPYLNIARCHHPGRCPWEYSLWDSAA